MLGAIEKVTIGESFALAGVSMSIIMAVLAAIMVLIYLMSGAFKLIDKYNPELKAKIDAFFAKFAPKKAEEKVEESEGKAVSSTQPKNAVTAKGSCGNITLVNVSDREAAMIMAIVADKMQTPLNELRFKSIKKID